MAGSGRRVVFALLPVVVLLGGSEVALRAAGWPEKDPKREFVHNEVYYKEPGSLHLEARDHKETGNTFRESTDANGLRAPIHPEEKAAGVFRILTMGCSTTFGWGVDDDQSYPARLEAVLKEHGKSNVEVINGGQPGQTSLQGLWMWDNVFTKYHPDLVVFGYIVQDSRKVAYTDKSQAILQGNDAFLKQNFLYRAKLYLFVKDWIDGWRIQSKDQTTQVARVPLDEYVENIRAFKARTDAVGATFMLFGFPLERSGYTEDHRAVLHAAAEEMKVPLYDPQPEFERYSASRTLYFPQDRGHANAEGCDLIARGMSDFFDTAHLLPGSAGPAGP